MKHCSLNICPLSLYSCFNINLLINCSFSIALIVFTSIVLVLHLLFFCCLAFVSYCLTYCSPIVWHWSPTASRSVLLLFGSGLLLFDVLFSCCLAVVSYCLPHCSPTVWQWSPTACRIVLLLFGSLFFSPILTAVVFVAAFSYCMKLSYSLTALK